MTQTDGEACRILLTNVQTMCEEAGEIISAGSVTGFAEVRAQLQLISSKMERAVILAVEAAGVTAPTEEGRREIIEAQRIRAFEAFDLDKERAALMRAARGPERKPREAGTRRAKKRRWSSRRGSDDE